MVAGYCAVPKETLHPSGDQAGCTRRQQDPVELPGLGRRLKLCLVNVYFSELFAVNFEKRLGLVWAV